MQRSGRSIWPMTFFLAGFAILLSTVSFYYLIPALVAAKDATAAQRRALSAQATLLLAVVLVILLTGMLLVVRARRFFSSRTAEKSAPTRYVDAWSESAKRMPTPPPEEDKSA